ncbi:MAG TPA: phosphoribosylamine--glycine ligase [Ramlibacter sp.]|jgi:phosphoribosylamine--glycine ligase|uniref:phosphoribosylamine--glycine ligase n=1 Tax=Ramlibacter sp. TaxID=1917967 RepID=UPI002D59D31A|nr:phosphoribosylamine--glycine ligase [Ramlibacter sp.]HZY17871.1 phosphoribosylamine--glycine ligase [Ramlibacter sp.]
MRILGIGETNDLAAMYHGFVRRGHAVRVFVADPACADVFAGMLDFCDDWERELGWVREAGEDGLVLFESATRGELQDRLRREGFQVIGGSALGDRLEADREFGQQVLRDAGLKTAASHRFTDYAAATRFLREHPGRYVLKFNGADGARTRNFVSEMEDGCDVLALLSLYAARAAAGEAVDFVLMQHVEGVEVGVGAYFNGREFLQPACIDFEHKRFFPGELGELTGEMGTIVSYRGATRLFEAALAPVAPLLREGGYVGYINVNLIANADGLWPLEFTSRFGYPGFAICEALHEEPWEAIFRRMLRRDGLAIATRRDFACGIVLSVPPFPYRHGYEALSKGAPICLRDSLGASDREHLHFAEVARLDGQLVTSGATGYVGVATGVGATVESANAEALRIARGVVVPNLRYRRDIGERVARGDLVRLQSLGWYDSPLSLRMHLHPAMA